MGDEAVSIVMKITAGVVSCLNSVLNQAKEIIVQKNQFKNK